MRYTFLIFLLLMAFSCESQKRSDNTLKTKFDINPTTVDTATFAGGCFWCVEAVFDRVIGVKEAVSGYSGGKQSNANYSEVSNGRTEHAEAVEIYFDPEIISYGELLQIFFDTHDASQLNRQGPDVGKQYRSEIFYHNNSQKALAENLMAQLQEAGSYNKPIVTKLTRYKEFYIAEDYHQDYYKHNPKNPYVLSVTKPKIDKFMKQYKDKLKPEYR